MVGHTVLPIISAYFLTLMTHTICTRKRERERESEREICMLNILQYNTRHYIYSGMCPRWSAVVGIGHHSKVADRHSSPPTTYLAAATDFRLGIKRLEIVTTVRLAVAACRTSSRTRTTALTARKRGHYNLQRAQLLFILSILPVFSQLFLNNALCSATTIII